MNKQASPTIAVGMSGGVDSSVTAYLLNKAGHSILGVTFSFFAPCGGADNGADARAVADVLGISHQRADLSEGFCQEVIDPFIEAYCQGETPNPCMLCNRGVKFGPQALSSTGAEHFATGHYANIGYDSGTGRHLLLKGSHTPKDQSYFLSGLSQAQLSVAHFPLGGYSKDQVREIAKEAKLPTAFRSDSQDICFIPDGDYAKFIQEKTGKDFPKGKFLDTEGKELGQHQGIISYTVGQRRGLGVASGGRLYVTGLSVADNVVTLGPNEALFSRTLRANRLNFIATDNLKQPVTCQAKIRSRHAGDEAVVQQIGEDEIQVTFTRPQRAITAGQAVVLYDGDTVIASGIILNETGK